MPCYDSRDRDNNIINELREELSKKEAMLCGITRAIMNDMPPFLVRRLMERVDWEEVGVTKDDFFTWWAAHVEKDLERKKSEKK